MDSVLYFDCANIHFRCHASEAFDMKKKNYKINYNNKKFNLKFDFFFFLKKRHFTCGLSVCFILYF